MCLPWEWMEIFISMPIGMKSTPDFFLIGPRVASRSMSRRVQRMVVEKVSDSPDETHDKEEEKVLDWSTLLDHAAFSIFPHLSCRDRASLSSTCRSLRASGNHPSLWQALDLRPYNIDAKAALSLASRCKNLWKLQIYCPTPVSAYAIINLQARNLKELSLENCTLLTEKTIHSLADRHEALECLQINQQYFLVPKISSGAVEAIPIRWPHLKRLWISGVFEKDANVINAFATNFKNLTDIGFVDCGLEVDVAALGNITSLKFISVAGSTIRNWEWVFQHWSKLPCLIGLDVSRTDIPSDVVTGFFSSSFSLKVLCAFPAPVVAGVVSHDVGVVATCNYEKDSEISNWLERITSSSLLRVSEGEPRGYSFIFLLEQGTDLILRLLRSSQEEVQERAVMALVNFLFYDKNLFTVAVMRSGGDGIRILLNLARSWREELQRGAAKAIELLVNDEVAKVLLDEGGISILANLALSATNRSVAKAALVALSNLFVKEELKLSIYEAIGVKALVDLIVRWSRSAGDKQVLEQVVGVLAKFATVDKCRAEIASGGGVNALTTLIQTRTISGVLGKAAHALNILTDPRYRNGDNAVVVLDTKTIYALVQLTSNREACIRKEAFCVLWNVCCDDRNREAVAKAGGVEALVTLAKLFATRNFWFRVPYVSFNEVQWSAAGALWGLSRSEEYSIAICDKGGVAKLIELAISDDVVSLKKEKKTETSSSTLGVHEAAVAALWSLAFYPKNALRLVEEGGIDVIARLSTNSRSKVARLLCALTLTYILDQRMNDEIAVMGTCMRSEELERARSVAMKHVENFVKTVSYTQLLSAAAKSSDPTLLAGHEVSCSEAEIGRFVEMLQNPCPALKSCAAFAILQFTLPIGKHWEDHVRILHRMLQELNRCYRRQQGIDVK